MICLILCAPSVPAEEFQEKVDTILDGTSVSTEEVSGWQLGDMLEWLGAQTGQNLQKPIRFFLQAGGYLMLTAVLGLLAGTEAWRHSLDAVALLGFGTLSLEAMMSLTDSVVATAQDCENYLVSFVPVFSGVAAMGGQGTGALVYSGMFFTMSGFLAALIKTVLLPVMQIYFCFTACACIWGNPGIEEAASLFARCLHWLLKLCGILFSVVLGLQNVLANGVDSAALKTGKSALQGFIPVVGDAAAAALTGATAAVQLLKGSLALAALLALATLFVPVLLHCFLYTAAFAGAGVLASVSGQKQCGQLCHLYFEGARLCASVLILYFFMIFLSTALLLVTGNGG